MITLCYQAAVNYSDLHTYNAITILPDAWIGNQCIDQCQIDGNTLQNLYGVESMYVCTVVL